MPNSRTSPSSGIYSLRHWALTFKLTQQQIKTTRFAHHWDTTIRCRYFCRHRLYSRLTTPHRRTPISGRVSRPDLAPVSFSSFTFLREGITLQQSRQDGVVGTITYMAMPICSRRCRILMKMTMMMNAKSTSTGWAVSLTLSSSTSMNYRTVWTISSASLARPDGGSTTDKESARYEY